MPGDFKVVGGGRGRLNLPTLSNTPPKIRWILAMLTLCMCTIYKCIDLSAFPKNFAYTHIRIGFSRKTSEFVDNCTGGSGQKALAQLSSLHHY